MNPETLTRVIADYFSPKGEVAAVYLFGSHARGQGPPMSDVDVGVLLREERHSEGTKLRERYMVELSRLLRKDIHLVILNSAGEGLMKQVFSRGECIQVNHPEEHSLFRTTMFSRIADFSFYKSRMQAGLARKLGEMSDGR